MLARRSARTRPSGAMRRSSSTSSFCAPYTCAQKIALGELALSGSMLSASTLPSVSRGSDAEKPVPRMPVGT